MLAPMDAAQHLHNNLVSYAKLTADSASRPPFLAESGGTFRVNDAVTLGLGYCCSNIGRYRTPKDAISVEGILRSGNPLQIAGTVIRRIAILMIDLGFLRWLANKSHSDKAVNPDKRSAIVPVQNDARVSVIISVQSTNARLRREHRPLLPTNTAFVRYFIQSFPSRYFSPMLFHGGNIS